MAETIKFAKTNTPELRTVFINSDAYTDGGAEAVQEVAYTFATAVEYVRQMQKRGVELHDIANSCTSASTKVLTSSWKSQTAFPAYDLGSYYGSIRC